MFKINLRITLRTLWSNRGYTLLNLLGLTIGITCCLILFQYVSYERSFDNFHTNADQIVRMRLDIHDQGKLTMQSATVFPGLAPLMKSEFPEVENYCRLVDSRIAWSQLEPTQYNLVISNDQRNIKILEGKGYYADASFLTMFTIPFTKGNPVTALSDPNSIIISDNMARKYFGNEEPVGQLLSVREGGYSFSYKITGVFKNYPSNSHLVFNFLISYKTFDNLIHYLGKGKEQDPELTLGWYDFYDYFQLRKGSSWKGLESKLPVFCDRRLNSPSQIARNSRLDLYLMPMKDIHLFSHFNEEAEVNGDGRSVQFLFLVSILIITIAWINYTNLATVRSLERAREVGVRKVLGALRRDLISQFLLESFLLNFLALAIALILAMLLTPSFNRLIGKDLGSGLYMPISYLIGFVLLFLMGTLLSGIYPAFVLSGYHPVAVLKGAFKNSGKGQFLRKGLIIGQFTASIILIAGTIIVFQQVSFMRTQPLGANISQTLVLDGPVSLGDSIYKNSYLSFRNDLLSINDVKNMTASSSIMGKEIYMTNGARLASASNNEWYTFYFIYADYDFIPAFNMEMKAGRYFSKDYGTDKKAVLINEKAVALFGLRNPQEAIKESILYYGDTLKIVGVVADYHQQGLHVAINPIIFMLRPDAHNFYSIKFNTTNIHQAIAGVEKIWIRHFPSDPFSYFFLDETFDHQYKSDSQFGMVFGFFASMAILIACFGLLSLSAYNVIQRSKEIGIRKVIGASMGNIVILLSKEFIVLVLLAFLIATPVGWLLMKGWLQDFAYRIHIEWWVFIIAGMGAILVALITVSYQAIQAALTNPLTAIKSE